MREQQEEEVKLRQYLLGELTLEQQVLVEQRLFLDDEYSLLAQAVEDDLIDDYAYHSLDARERVSFENHFLPSPEHRADVRIAQALKRFAVAQPVSVGRESFFRSIFWRRPMIGISFATLLILLTFVGWIIVRYVRNQRNAPQIEAHDQRSVPITPNDENRPNHVRPEQAADRTPTNQESPEANKRDANERPREPEPRPSSGRQSSSVMAVTLAPGGLVRGSTQPTSVAVSPDVETVILRLPLTASGEYDSYLAILKRGGRTVQKFAALKSEVDNELGKIVPVKVPAKLLRAESYEIELSGITAERRSMEPAVYSFQVNRR